MFKEDKTKLTIFISPPHFEHLKMGMNYRCCVFSLVWLMPRHFFVDYAILLALDAHRVKGYFFFVHKKSLSKPAGKEKPNLFVLNESH